MVKDSGKGHPLFLAARQNVFPVGSRIPAAFPLYQMGQVDLSQARLQVLFGNALGLHVRQSVRVNYLFFQAAYCHVRPTNSHVELNTVSLVT